MPERYGNWKSAHKRFTRWAKGAHLGADLQGAAGRPQEHPDGMGIDSTIVRAHQQGARRAGVCGKGGPKTKLWGVPEEV